MVAPKEAKIHAKIETVPISASFDGNKIIPEPIILMAVMAVNWTTDIFLLSDNVVPFFLRPISDKRIGGIVVRHSPGCFCMKHTQTPFTFVVVKETGKKENRHVLRRSPLNCIMQGAIFLLIEI